ncbi:MAG: cytochrome P450 [Parvibaculaceae bacterium]
MLETATEGTSSATAIQGLGSEFDTIIKNLPTTIFGAPDEAWCTPDLSRDPFTLLADLRERAGPVVRMSKDGSFDGVVMPDPNGHDPEKPIFIALSHAAVTEIGSDANRFKNDTAYRVSQQIQGRTVNTLDGMEHRLMRRLLDKSMFGRKQMQEYLETLTIPTVDYLVGRMAERLEAGDTVEICRDLALPMTYKSISTILGVPERLFAEFIELGDRAFGFMRDPDGAMEAVETLGTHFESELQRHKSMDNPPRDFMTIMSDASLNDYQLTDEEIIMHCRFLLPGGIETTWRQTANLFMALMLNPDQWTAVVNDLSLVEQTVEEALRWVPSGFVVPRVAIDDTEVEGVAIPGGSGINSIQGIANRDPKVWDRPNEFDIFREHKPHLTFHAGAHFCMGQNLARNSFKTALTSMATRFPNLMLACDRSEIEMCGFGLHVVRKLPLKLG